MTVEEVYRAINWTTVILVGAMLPLSTAIAETGAAQLMAEASSLVGGFGPRALLAGLFVLTTVLGQVISNTATALILIPISVVAAPRWAFRRAVLMGVAVAAAASFLRRSRRPRTLWSWSPAATVRRLLEVRPALHALVLRGRRRARARHLAVLKTPNRHPAARARDHFAASASRNAPPAASARAVAGASNTSVGQGRAVAPGRSHG